MRTLILSLIFISFILPAAQADDVAAAVVQQQAKTDKDLADLQQNKKEMEAMIKDLEKDFGATLRKYGDDKFEKNTELFTTNKTLDRKRYEDLQADIARLTKMEEEARVEFEKVKKENEGYLAKIDKDIAKTKQELITQKLMADGPISLSASSSPPVPTSSQIKPAAVPLLLKTHDQEIKAVNVKLDLQALEAQFEGADDKIDELERLYDRSQVGTYVQEKVSQLVNSITICRAMRRCAVKDETPIDAKSIQEELFPESKATRSEHYQKVKTRRTGSSQ